MNTCPTIKIAMFGSRSTGKTTFLTSFVGVTQEQGCDVNVVEGEDETKAYFKDALVKIESALAKGKKTEDKRQSIKERDSNRDIQKELKRKNNY